VDDISLFTISFIFLYYNNSRPPPRSSPGFVWCVHERDVPFSDLPESQIVNHFQGISKLTSKQGLCELIREAAWLLVDAQEICPRYICRSSSFVYATALYHALLPLSPIIPTLIY
jgi:hypothetical protein